MHLPEEIKAGELIENIGGEAMSVRVPGDSSPHQSTLYEHLTNAYTLINVVSDSISR